MTRKNPCLTCGACCAFYRVSFYWGETTDSPEGTVPAHLTEDLTPFYRTMKGSNQKKPRCIALEGEIGKLVHCTIYEQRSTSCREFALEFIDGQVVARPEDYERCTRARSQFNLSPIQVDVLRSVPIQPTAIEPLQSPWPLTRRRKNKKTAALPSAHRIKIPFSLRLLSSPIFYLVAVFRFSSR